MKLPPEYEYNKSMEECLFSIDKQYINQKKAIETQFDYLIKIIIQLRDLEISYLGSFKDYCKGMYNELKRNFNQMKEDIVYGMFGLFIFFIILRCFVCFRYCS